MSELLHDLNEAQQEAVRHASGPLLVVAGPGTGKTRTLTRRIAYLIRDRGQEPGILAAITFTNRAAREMRERLEDLLPGRADAIGFVGTFHSLGLDIVRREARQLGFDQDPVLYGEEDQKALFRELLNDAAESKPRRLPVEKVMNAIESCLNRNIPVAGDVEGFDITDLHKAYTQKKQDEGAVDFNDLILRPMELFERNPDIMARYRQRFRHLFLDEYQDVNWLQVKLTQMLGGDADSIMAIGDPDQAIYSFRGSDVKNFLNFPETFPGARVLHLNSNYRSSGTILDASGQVISNNQVRLGTAEPAQAMGEKGLRLDQRELTSDKAEAVFVSRTIERLAGGIGRYGLIDGPHGSDPDYDDDGMEYGFGDIAVLYRLNAQARLIRDALDSSGIPYQQVGSSDRDSNQHERFVLAGARLSVAPENRSAWRIMNQFREKLTKSRKKELPAFDTDRMAEAEAFEGVEDKDLFFHVAKTFTQALPAESDALMCAAQSLTDCVLESQCSVKDFLAGAPLAMREDPFEAKSQKVTLSSIHASKGLEFPVVFIVGLEEGLMPYIRDDEEFLPAALEEERRLLYVGMTRAQSELYLTHARKRVLFGKRLEGKPSPFLKHISDDLLSFIKEKSRTRKKAKDDGHHQQSLF